MIKLSKQAKLTKKFEEVANNVSGKQNIKSAANVPDENVANIEVLSKIYVKYQSKAIYNSNPQMLDEERKNFKIDDTLPSIVLVLESPHKDELCYYHPAAGTTGENINDYFLKLLTDLLAFSTNSDSIDLRSNFLIKDNTYRLIIANPIQYQCSLGLENSKYKKKIFKKCWESEAFKADFIARLKSYRPALIINCCTGGEKNNLDGLQKLVQEEINKNFITIPKAYGYHPSTDYFLRGFKLITV